MALPPASVPAPATAKRCCRIRPTPPARRRTAPSPVPRTRSHADAAPQRTVSAPEPPTACRWCPRAPWPFGRPTPAAGDATPNVPLAPSTLPQHADGAIEHPGPSVGPPAAGDGTPNVPLAPSTLPQHANGAIEHPGSLAVHPPRRFTQPAVASPNQPPALPIRSVGSAQARPPSAPLPRSPIPYSSSEISHLPRHPPCQSRNRAR